VKTKQKQGKKLSFAKIFINRNDRILMGQKAGNTA